MNHFTHYFHLAPIALLGPTAAMIPLAVAGLAADGDRVWPFVIYGILVLVMVEWGIARRLGDHRDFVNRAIDRMTLQANSLDAQHDADVKRMERIETIATDARASAEALATRTYAVERKLGIRE